MTSGMWFMGLNWIWMLLLLVGLIALAVWIVRLLFPQNPERPVAETSPRESALEIAERRYAEGELSREEYDSLRQDLT